VEEDEEIFFQKKKQEIFRHPLIVSVCKNFSCLGAVKTQKKSNFNFCCYC
jgi:hypothetical protein